MVAAVPAWRRIREDSQLLMMSMGRRLKAVISANDLQSCTKYEDFIEDYINLSNYFGPLKCEIIYEKGCKS